MVPILGQIIDIQNKRIFPGELQILDGRISEIKEVASAPHQFILPGFIDAHIHIESSMLVPYEFAKMALRHGTVATVSDPHEIANVLGIEGVQYMIENAKGAFLKFHFGAPSCVPATQYETAGAQISVQDVESLLQSEDIYYLSEMMNYPGVLYQDEEVMKKIGLAKKINKPIDGHAPGLTGQDAIKYIEAGISTDHECFTLEEAQHKMAHGMHILIREGSAARNYEALHPLIHQVPEMVMFCSDDKHPDDLEKGHIDELARRSIKQGYDLFDILRIACLNPIEHYGLKVGQLKKGDSADFIIVKDLSSFDLIATYIEGQKVADANTSILRDRRHEIVNHFLVHPKSPADFDMSILDKTLEAIVALDGEIITERKQFNTGQLNHDQVNLEEDILKIAVVNRYANEPVALGHITGFQIKNGAIASSVAHDSHNIVVVGSNAKLMCDAVNLIIAEKGGLSAVSNDRQLTLPLPIAGLMSQLSCEEVAAKYDNIDSFAKAKLQCGLRAPFMTLSFMALLVIPKLKMSDQGMFDAEKFELCRS